MKITHIRNATLLVEYEGKTFLIDPMLAKKGTYPPFSKFDQTRSKQPFSELIVIR